MIPSVNDYVGIVINHCTNLAQIGRFDIVLLAQHKPLTIPFVFGISILTHHMDVDRCMFKAEEHKYESVCSE